MTQLERVRAQDAAFFADLRRRAALAWLRAGRRKDLSMEQQEPTALSPIDQSTGTRGRDSGAAPQGYQTGFKNRGKDIQPGVNAPIQTAAAIRGADEGAIALPLELEENTRAADADAPQ